jgi:hypothetical protein
MQQTSFNGAKLSGDSVDPGAQAGEFVIAEGTFARLARNGVIEYVKILENELEYTCRQISSSFLIQSSSISFFHLKNENRLGSRLVTSHSFTTKQLLAITPGLITSHLALLNRHTYIPLLLKPQPQ